MHPTINLTIGYSKDSISFPDTQVTLVDRGNIATSVHRKPTNNLTDWYFSMVLFTQRTLNRLSPTVKHYDIIAYVQIQLTLMA